MPRRPTLLLTLILSLIPPAGAAWTQGPPVPLPRPQAAPEVTPAEVPVPDRKPPRPATEEPAEQETERPIPREPEEVTSPADFIGPPAPPKRAETRPPPEPETPPILAEDPAKHEQCLKDLADLGTIFETAAPIDDGDGCGISRPITVRDILPGIKLAPEATFRCETALQLAKLTRETIIPAARIALADKGDLKGIHQASAYVCRNRNGAETGKISEHARGNAIDIAALEFEKGTVPMVIAAQDDGSLPAAFQRSLNASACLYFTTVLSPGSDEAHQDHLHLDVIERKSGYRFCR